jgi:hypothetical protein
MGLPIDEGDSDVHDRISGEDAARCGGPDPLLHRRDVLPRDDATDGVIGEGDARSPGSGTDRERHARELARAPPTA